MTLEEYEKLISPYVRLASLPIGALFQIAWDLSIEDNYYICINHKDRYNDKSVLAVVSDFSYNTIRVRPLEHCNYSKELDTFYKYTMVIPYAKKG
jgi:hypothetical protein